eukprot:scaffold121_cov92-Cylindrotheca_fusiformis.AAC.1
MYCAVVALNGGWKGASRWPKEQKFVVTSSLSNIVKSCDGDGYRALKAIIFQSHPAFHPQPATLVTAYPRQRNDSSLLEYYQLFLDFQQLRAYIHDIELTLDSDSELDVFIKNAKYGEYLNRVTRDERTIFSLKHKYRGPQAIETLSMWLMAPDSPLTLEKRQSGNTRPTNPAPFRRFPSRIPPRSPPTTARVNRIDTVNDDILDNIDFEAELDSIEVPDDRDSKTMFHKYCVSVNQIQTSPKSAESSRCIVCNGNHRFADCPVLANQDFLRAHYVRYCQQLRRDAAARAQALGPDSRVPTIKQSAPVHFVDSYDDDHGLVTDDESDHEPDFQLGRI